MIRGDRGRKRASSRPRAGSPPGLALLLTIAVGLFGGCGEATDALAPRPAPPAPPATAHPIDDGPSVLVGRRVEAGPWRFAPVLPFPVVRPDCGLRIRDLVLENAGERPGAVEILSLDPPFALHPAQPSRFEVEGGMSYPLEVWLAPPGPGAYAGSARLRFDDAPPVETALSADIVPGHEVHDRFVMPEVPKVDVLFVFDDSPSMADSRLGIAQNMQAFMQFVAAQGLDARAGFTTGRYGPRGLSGSLYVFEALGRPWLRGGEAGALAAALETGLAPKATPARELLRAAVDVYEKSVGGFRREGAFFAAIAVSDGLETSPGAVDGYIDRLREGPLPDADGGPPWWRPWPAGFSAITAPVPPGHCSGPGGTARSGGRLLEAAEALRGVFQSICTSDWSRSLEDLSTSAFGFKWRRRLSRAPRVDTLKVSVDGERVPAQSSGGTVNWTYDAATNSLSFAPYSSPEPGSEVDLRYVAACPVK